MLYFSFKVSQEDILRGKNEQKVKDLAYSIASVAHQHLETVSFIIFYSLYFSTGNSRAFTQLPYSK